MLANDWKTGSRWTTEIKKGDAVDVEVDISRGLAMLNEFIVGLDRDTRAVKGSTHRVERADPKTAASSAAQRTRRGIHTRPRRPARTAAALRSI